MKVRSVYFLAQNVMRVSTITHVVARTIQLEIICASAKHIHAVAMNLLSQENDRKCRQTTTKRTHRYSIQTKMTCKDDEPTLKDDNKPMDTIRKDEENQIHHDDGNKY